MSDPLAIKPTQRLTFGNTIAPSATPQAPRVPTEDPLADFQSAAAAPAPVAPAAPALMPADEPAAAAATAVRVPDPLATPVSTFTTADGDEVRVATGPVRADPLAAQPAAQPAPRPVLDNTNGQPTVVPQREWEGPSLLDTDVGRAITAGLADTSSPLAVLDSFEAAYGEAEMDTYVDAVAQSNTEKQLAALGITPDQRGYIGKEAALLKKNTAKAQSEFDLALRSSRVQRDKLAALKTEPGQVAQEKKETAGFIGQMFSQLGSGFTSGLAGTADLANLAASAASGQDEAFGVDLLTDISSELGEVSAEARANQTALYQRQDSQIRSIFSDESASLGSKLVRGAVSLMDREGLDYIAANLMYGAGWTVSSLAGGGLVGAGAKLALKGGASVAGTKITSKVAQNVATQKIAGAMATTTAKRAGTAASIAAPLGASEGRAIYDQIGTALENNPQSVRNLPGWQAAKRSLELELRQEPTDTQVDDRFKNRVAYTTTGVVGAATMVGTFVAPATEGFVKGAAGRLVGIEVAPTIVGRSTSAVGARVAGAGREAVAEGFEEYVQTVAGEASLRVIGAQQSVGTAISASTDSDAQMAAFIGAVVGGSGGALATKPRTPGDTDTDSNTADPLADAPVVASEQDVALQEAVTAGAATAQAVTRANLKADHDLDVSENAKFGLGETHGVFSETDESARVYETFFSDGNRALGVDPESGALGYGVSTADNGVVWTADPSGVQGMQDLIDAADLIQMTAATSVGGGDMDVDLAALYARRIDAQEQGSPLAATQPINELVGPQFRPSQNLLIPEELRAEREAEAVLERDAETQRTAVKLYRDGSFPGLLALAEDAQLEGQDAAAYSLVTRARLEERANWYTSVFGSKSRLARTMADRLTELPRNQRESKAVAALLNEVQAATTDSEREVIAQRSAGGSRTAVGERAVAYEVLGMLEAKKAIYRALWAQKGKTARATSDTELAGAVADVAIADPLAQQGAPKNAQGLMSTLTPEEVVAPTLSQMEVEATTLAADASQDALENVSIGVETEGANVYVLRSTRQPDGEPVTLSPAQSAGVGVFKRGMVSDTKAILRKIVSQRMQLGGEYTRTLTAAGRARPEVVTVPTEQQNLISQAIDKLLVTFAARRSAEGVDTQTLLFEMMHVAGAPRAKVLQAIEQSRNINPADATELDARAQRDYGAKVLNAVSDQTYADPVSQSAIGAFVKRLNNAFKGRGLTFSYYNTEAEYIADAFDQPIPAVGASAAFVPGRGDQDSRIFFVRNRIPDEAALQRIATHEVAIHYGLREIMTEEGIADIGSQILRSDDKPTRNLVNATVRKIVKARVAAQREAYSANGMAIPSDLEQQVEADVRRDEVMLGEEVLAAALEAGADTNGVQQGTAARMLETLRQSVNTNTDFIVNNVNDMASVVAAARDAGGVVTSDWMNPNYRGARGVVHPTGHKLNLFQRFQEFATNEEAPLYRLALSARQLLDRGDAADRIEAVLERGEGLQRSMRRQMNSRHLTPMFNKLDAIRESDGMDKQTFYYLFDQYLYLKHSEERIEGLARLHGALAVPENQARRSQIMDAATRPGVTDSEIATLRDELYAMVDPALEPVVNRDPDFGAHLVGRSYRTIAAHRADLQAHPLYAKFEALDLHNKETGHMRLLTEEVLQHRKASTYGDSGYGLTRLLGWNFYVPMSDYEGPKNSNNEPDLLRINHDALKPGAWYVSAADGRYSEPQAPVFSQLENLTSTVARDVVVNNLHRGIADATLTLRDVDGEGSMRLKPDDAMSWMIEDEVAESVRYDEVGRTVGSLALKYDKEAVKVAWNPDGTAHVFAIKDIRSRNALKVRQTDSLSESTSLWMKPFKALRAGTRVFGTLLTAWNPQFVLMRQLPRDLAQAMVQAGFEQNLGIGGTAQVAQRTMAILPDMQRYFLASPEAQQQLLDGWRDDPESKMHNFARRADLGGVTFFEDQLLNPTEDAGAGLTLTDGPVRQIIGRGVEGAANLRRYTESLSNSADNAVRQALMDGIYEAEMAKRSETGRTEADILAEASDIATSMLNFGQRSSLGRTMSIIHPFAQTALTGADSIVQRRMWKGGRAPVEQIVQQDGSIVTQLRGGYTKEGAFGEGGWAREINTPMLATLGTMGIGSSLAALAAIQGMIDDDDQDLDEDQFGDILRPSSLMRSYFMPASGGSRPITVAVQPGYIGAMHAFGTAMVLYSNDNFDKTEVTRALRDAMLYNLTPLNGALGTEMGAEDLLNNVIPTLFQPILQASANTNAFGNRIFSPNENGEALGVSELVPRTSTPRTWVDMAESVREIGEAVGVDVDPNPELMRHWVTSYAGGIGHSLDRAFKGVHASVQGDPDPNGERWLELAGLVPADPRYAHTNTYFDLLDKHVNPIINTAKRRARLEDLRAGAIESNWQLRQPGGPALKAFFARYGGAANVRNISKTVTGMQRVAGDYKKQLDAATAQGNTDEVQRVKELLRKEYRARTKTLRGYLEVAGITS